MNGMSGKELLAAVEDYLKYNPTRFTLLKKSSEYIAEYYMVADNKTKQGYRFIMKYGSNPKSRNIRYCSINAEDHREFQNVITRARKELDSVISSKWNRRFLDLAKHVSGYSKDPSTKVGAVVVDDDGNVRTVAYNGFPRGVYDTEQRLNNRELKYQYVVHSELNAIAHCARIGVPTKGATLVCTHCPCSVCAGAIVQAGFKEVVVFAPNEDFSSRWSEKNAIANSIFTEGGVDVIVIPEEVKNE